MQWIGRAPGLAAVLAIVVTAGCTAGSNATGDQPEIGTVQVVRSGSELALPLDAYRLSAQEYLSIQRVSWRLTRDCVSRFGGAYTLAESSVTDNAPPDVGATRRYGLFDARSAADYGYNLPPDTPGSESASRRSSGKGGWNPSNAELILVRGAPSGGPVPQDNHGKPLPAGGCSGEATRLVEAGVTAPTNSELGDQLAVEAHQKSESDSRVRAAMDKWSACMQKRGYSYRSIWEPNDKSWPEPAGNDEIATAKADVECKLSTNLVGVWYAVEVARQKAAIEDRSTDLDAVRTYLRASVRRAAQLGGAG